MYASPDPDQTHQPSLRVSLIQAPHLDLSIQCSSRHNVHSHVIGIPGACFGWYSSCASADEAYAQALLDGTVHELPL